MSQLRNLQYFRISGTPRKYLHTKLGLTFCSVATTKLMLDRVPER